MTSISGQSNPFSQQPAMANQRKVVAFRGKSQAAKSQPETDTVELKGQASKESKPSATAQEKPDGWQDKFFGDKTRLAAGFILEDVVPPLLGFAFIAGPIGWLVTLGSLPLSYAAGKAGRRIAGSVNHNNLTGGMKSFHDFREGFRNRHTLQGTQLLDKWNIFIDDALNIRSGQYRSLIGMMAGGLKIGQNSKLGKILSSPQFLKANVYHDVAQADSIGKAFKAGAKGGMGFWVYQVALPGAGQFMEKTGQNMWGPFKLPFIGIGWILKNLPLLKLGKDMMSTPKPKTAS
jgi:hypothetical protein